MSKPADKKYVVHDFGYMLPVLQFKLRPDEYITSVKGHTGKFNGMTVLRSLKFETNLETFGPYGKEDGMPFELPATNGQIIGFHGRSGQFLDALGVYVKGM